MTVAMMTCGNGALSQEDTPLHARDRVEGDTTRDNTGVERVVSLAFLQKHGYEEETCIRHCEGKKTFSKIERGMHFVRCECGALGVFGPPSKRTIK